MMRANKPAISDVQKRVANTSIGASTLRGRKRGTIDIVRKFLYKSLDLTELDNLGNSEFSCWLDDNTEKLMEELPEPNWGDARKSINIFLENAFYNKFLSKHYNLDTLVGKLEIPLDSNVARGLKADMENWGIKTSIPGWKSIQGLKPEISKEYQDSAQEIAQLEQTSRIYLDLKYWKKERD